MNKKVMTIAVSAALTVALGGCQPYMTKRDNTLKGAGIGAGVGAVAAIVSGKRKADQILTGAAIGAGIGAGIGAYMDAQEERIARIPGTTVERIDDETLIVRFASDVLFAVDSASLSGSSQATLSEVSGVVSEFDKTAVIIQGHTDSSGSDQYNQALSERRAESVRSFLSGQGVNPGRMLAEGYGESSPIASNESAAGRSQNRRVAMMLRAKA